MPILRSIWLAIAFLFILSATTLQAAPRIDKEIECLTWAVYTEARGEGRKGMIAVANVIINRSESGKYPKDICKVVNQPYQFEGMRHAYKPIKEPHYWDQAKEVATLSFYGLIEDTTNGALYFHARYIMPSWAYVKDKTLSLGNHIFYK